MELYGLSGLFIVITCLVIPLIIFVNSGKEERRTTRLWVLLNISTALYGFGIFFVAQTSDYNTALFWWKIAYLGIVFIPTANIHHLYKLLEEKPPKGMIFILYALSFGFFVIIQTMPQYFFSLMRVFDAFYFPDALSPSIAVNFFFSAFVLFFVSTTLLSVYKLVRARAVAYGDRRMQLTFFLIGIIMGFGGGGSSYLVDYHINFYPILNFVLPFYHVSIAYATVRYGLYKTKIVAAEMLVAFMSIIFFINFLAPDSVILNILLFIGLFFISVILVRGAIMEAKIRDELKNLNEHLEQKVVEQTIEIRKSYEIEKKARIELEELNKAKDQFILTTQHHLRTPLTIVKGYIQSLLNNPPQVFVSQTKSYLEKVLSATDRVSNLVNEFLDISQMEIGKSILNKQPTNIRELVSGIINDLNEEVHKKDLTVKVDIKKDIIIDVDFIKFREAITNIIDNAVKYNVDKGSVIIKGENINHPIERNNKIFKLTIENTGIGLTTEELSSLFTQYFQRGEEAEKIYTTGRGIGLVVTKNIIQAHGGRIYAESEGRDKGARFMVEMPI